MRINILLIGRYSFTGSNLYNFFKRKKKIKIKKTDFEKFLKFNNNYLSKFDFVINCSTNNIYRYQKYDLKKDFDLAVTKKLINQKAKLIIFSTRDVYGPGFNLKEDSIKKPINHNGKNRIITEKKILKIRNNIIIFRVSNIVGRRIYRSKRRITNLFFDIIKKNLKKNVIIIPSKNYYKDFIFVDDFVRIVYLSILKNISGIYNLSSNTKTYLKDLANWISNKTNAKILYSKIQSDSFTMNNEKLFDKLRINKKLLNLKNKISKVI